MKDENEGGKTSEGLKAACTPMPLGRGVFRKKLVLVDHRRETHAIAFQLIAPDQMPFSAQHNPGSLDDRGRQLYLKLDPGVWLVLRPYQQVQAGTAHILGLRIQGAGLIVFHPADSSGKLQRKTKGTASAGFLAAASRWRHARPQATGEMVQEGSHLVFQVAMSKIRFPQALLNSGKVIFCMVLSYWSLKWIMRPRAEAVPGFRRSLKNTIYPLPHGRSSESAC